MPKTDNKQLCPGRVLLDTASAGTKMFVIVGASHTDVCMLHLYDAQQMKLLPPQKSVALATTLPHPHELNVTHPLYADSTNTLIASLTSLSEKLGKGKIRPLGKIDRRDLGMLTKTLRASETIPLAILQEFFAAH
jgi:hypothetical protein